MVNLICVYSFAEHIRHQYYTNALKPVIDLPAIRELISFVP